MNLVCVGTSSSGAYYEIVSRLRRAGMPFKSILPGEASNNCDVVLTTTEEGAAFGDRAMTLESLSDAPGVLKGQVLSRLSKASETLLIGIDPGKRTGMAAFYGNSSLAFNTFGSTASLCANVGEFLRVIQSRKSMVRVGNGNPRLADQIAQVLSVQAPATLIEVVDEAGTSRRTRGIRGLQGDMRAAVKIAHRKGVVFTPDRSRNLS